MTETPIHGQGSHLGRGILGAMKKKDGKIGEPSGVLCLPALHVWTIAESSLFLSLALFETCEPGAGGVNARRRQHGRDPDESQETHTRGRPPGPRSQRDPDSYRNGPSCRTPQWWLSSRLFVRRLCVSMSGACAMCRGDGFAADDASVAQGSNSVTRRRPRAREKGSHSHQGIYE